MHCLNQNADLSEFYALNGNLSILGGNAQVQFENESSSDEEER